MTIILTPEKALAVEKAIAAGLVANADEILDAGLAAIEFRVPPRDERPGPETAEEWIREFREFVESHKKTGGPGLYDYAISRESIYEDCGL